MARLLRIDGILSRTESIDGFHLKLSRIEKALYEEFLTTEEAEILAGCSNTLLRRNKRLAESVSMIRASDQESKAQSMPGSRTLVPISM